MRAELFAPWRRLPGLLLALAAAIWPAGSAPAGDLQRAAPVAISADLSVHDGRTRLTLALSRAVEATSFALDRPDRIVIDLPDVNVQVPPEAGRRRVGLVAGFRCGLIAAGRSRLILDLSAPATVARLEVADGPIAGSKQLVVELVRADRDAFRRAAGAEPTVEVTGSIGPASGIDRRPLVALDAGHGGTDPGATATSGVPEKDITLAFTRTLAERLQASGEVRVVLTRDRDVFVPLDERVRRARAAGADLFVSIHADSIDAPSVRGATIYTGSERATDVESAQLADRENAADGPAGPAAASAEPSVHDILQDLTHRETRGLSHRFAGLLHGQLGTLTRFSAQPHREAGFRVLRAPDMPSVLFELGYLSNTRDADLLTSEDWRGRTGAAMAGAIERFFAARRASRAAMSP